MNSIFYECFPPNRRHLLGPITGSSLIAEMTEVQFRSLIIGCLTGDNPRLQTENRFAAGVLHGVLTGLQEMFSKGKEKYDDFVLTAPTRASSYLFEHRTRGKNTNYKLSNNDLTLCNWISNLTDKGFDNILNKDPALLKAWGSAVMDSIEGVPYGNIEQNIMNIAIYNASLSKKGGLKSAMGNLFETLLLFTGLLSCGLKFVSRDLIEAAKVPSFTLDVTEGRQSDARINTCLEMPNKLDIDIGFIGEGNPEITADKIQRFGGANTIIIIGAAARIQKNQIIFKEAAIAGAKVITMTGDNWIHNLAKYLKDVGIQDISYIPENIDQARSLLNETLMSARDILRSVPKDIIVPTNWA